MKTFVRVVEIWLPDPDQQLLEFGGGCYGEARRFAAASTSMLFGRGEGLPGRAWTSAAPVILKSFEGSYFRRTAAAQADGLTCGIALPFFKGDRLTAVAAIFCGDDADHAGALELWHNNPTQSPDMTLEDGYYGTTADVFEFTSRNTAFRVGTGLPGLAWREGQPVFMADLGKSTHFLRADSARRVGINRGFAFPLSVPGPDTWILACLSALATPLVARLETWLPDASGQRIARVEGHCEQAGTLAASAPGEALALGEGAIGRAWANARPELVHAAAGEPGGAGLAARQAGLRSLVALPVVHEGRVTSVVAWYF